MNTAAELRRQVESALAGRIPSALSMRPIIPSELVSCGVIEVDTALGGGLPLGGISELTGTASSGRTTLAMATLASITQQGGTGAYVDVSDSFDPISASALGVNLRRLLWVRAGESDAAVVNSPVSAAAPAMPVIREKQIAGGWNHPRSEAIGMDHAVGELFRGQHESPRNSHGGSLDLTPRCSESIRHKRIEPVILMPRQDLSRIPSARAQYRHSPQKPWSRLDQALRATDLLLNAGGFRAIVLDMGDIRPEDARRVPLTTWYRFRLQVEKAQMLFLLLTRVACANSCTAISLRCEEALGNWHQTTEKSPSLLTGLGYCISVTRRRTVDPYRKKPVTSAQVFWSSTTSWSR